MIPKFLFNSLVFVFFLFSSITTMAANHFVRAGATGSNIGSDWINAYTTLPITLIRGDTYYVSGGSYSGRIFNTPTSGSLVITIKGATVSDHGTDLGWNNSYSVEMAQAIWTSRVVFSTSYWVFDGSVGPNWSKNPADYGFTFLSTNAYPIIIGSNITNTTNFTISHIAATAPSGDQEKLFLSTGGDFLETDNVTLSHSYFKGWQSVWWANSWASGNLAGTHYQDNWLSEYNMILNQWGSAAHHSETINNVYGTMNNLIVRYNWFEGSSNGGITGIICANGADNINAKIYGNVFKDLTAGNGIITGTSGGNLVSPQVYNNTFINSPSGGWIGGYTTGTPLVYNNLLYNMDASRAVVTDYNAYFNTTNTPTEAHIQIGTGSPFVNVTGDDLRLLNSTLNGFRLLTPYNVDVNGTIRGIDGIWDRGAFEFGNLSSGGSTLTAPRNLRIL